MNTRQQNPAEKAQTGVWLRVPARNWQQAPTAQDENEKCMIANTGYEVKQSIRIGGKEIVLAENPDAEDGQFYLVCNYIEYGLIGEYSIRTTSGEYIDVMLDFAGRLYREIHAIVDERKELNLPSALFTAEHCHPNDYSQSIAGKVVAIKAKALAPEYRSGDNQLVYVTPYGCGALANTTSGGMFCYKLNNRFPVRYDRSEVLGEVKQECLLYWAKENLAAIKDRKDEILRKIAGLQKGTE